MVHRMAVEAMAHEMQLAAHRANQGLTEEDAQPQHDQAEEGEEEVPMQQWHTGTPVNAETSPFSSVPSPATREIQQHQATRESQQHQATPRIPAPEAPGLPRLPKPSVELNEILAAGLSGGIKVATASGAVVKCDVDGVDFGPVECFTEKEENSHHLT